MAKKSAVSFSIRTNKYECCQKDNIKVISNVMTDRKKEKRKKVMNCKTKKRLNKINGDTQI
jgi:hypothetical protein